MVTATFGDVDQVCHEINEAAIELAVTPLESSSDYPVVRRAIEVMLELRRCFEVMKPDLQVIIPDGWGEDVDE